MSSKKDNYYLNQALNLAKDINGLTGSNPAVGALIVKNDEILSLGKTGFNGRPHAEFNAIHSCSKKNLEGSTLYVTLEPCTHFGKTPPCTDLILRSKISKVVYGSLDVDMRTANKANKILNKNKIKVKYVKQKKIENFYKPYKFQKKNNKPFITGKIACSKDNYIFYDKFKYIKNIYSRKFAHILRYRNEALLISYKTINMDNPILDCRLNGLRKFSPKIIVLDKNLKTRTSSNILKNAKNLKTIFFYAFANKKKIKLFKSKKAILIKMKVTNRNNFGLDSLAKKIYKLGISHILLEGGKHLTEEFLNNGLINEFYLIKSEILLKNSGKYKINKILNKLPKFFASKSYINTFVDKNKIIRYF